MNTIAEREKVNQRKALAQLGGHTVDAQFQAAQHAGLSLREIGYGKPSDETVARFGPDGSMKSAENIFVRGINIIKTLRAGFGPKA